MESTHEEPEKEVPTSETRTENSLSAPEPKNHQVQKRVLEKLALDPQRKPLLRLLEAIPSEWEGDTWLFRCNNKSEQALLLDHTPLILGLLQEFAGGRALRIEVVVRESALQNIAPKPGKPSEIRQAMAEKNPELLRFIQKFNFKVD